MRRVLVEHLGTLGFEVDDTAAHDDAVARLDRRFEAFSGDYAGVVVGWPVATDGEVEPLVNRLERDDLQDMPVVVMSADQRAATRAWVASRQRTAMLGWKRYRDIGPLLSRLSLRSTRTGTSYVPIDVSVAAPTSVDAVDVPPVAKFDNADIRLLVVDDSATIRRSLQDLFGLHGYTVSLAADAEQAQRIASSGTIDVAIVDFYLDDTTGDRVCRDLVDDPATGELVCAVLTGSYSDHIIRRSLRAGALECLFKNESSELLLNRIDALSRFVRQQRRLELERGLLDRVVDVVAGPALVLDASDGVRHVSSEGLQLLGHDDSAALIGRPVQDMLGSTALPVADGELHRCRFRRADGSQRDMLVERRLLGDDKGSVLQFGLADRLVEEAAPPKPVTSRGTAAVFVRSGRGTPVSAEPFVALLERYLSGAERYSGQASLLVVGVWVRSDDGAAPVPLRDNAELQRRLTPKVLGLYRRVDHVAALGDGRYGFVLRHADEPQSWLLTRKLMQMIDEADDAAPEDADGAARRSLLSSGVLKRLGSDRVAAPVLIDHCLELLVRVEARGLDQALLLDPRRLLSVYPGTA